jgi:DNA-binding NarL/FixJ family response regulator
LSRLGILLADSNPSMRAMLTELLDEEFEIVGAVHSGAEALRCLSENHPDLILLDVVLDDMNGFELGSQLREASPNAKVLYLSMYEGPAFVNAAFAAGARDMFSNPERILTWGRLSCQSRKVGSLIR